MLEEIRSHRRADDYPSAQASLDKAFSNCPETQYELLGYLHAMQGQLTRDQGNTQEALGSYQKALVLQEKAESDLRVAHVLRHLAEMEMELGRKTEAGDYFKRSHAIYESSSKGSEMDMANFYRAYALFHEEMNEDQKQAHELWSQARGIYEKYGIEEGIKEADSHLAT